MSDRPTVRPVTLARLVEVTHACESRRRTTTDIKATLEVSHRRARETILETLRIGLIGEEDEEDQKYYETTRVGKQFLQSVRNEDWIRVSEILETRSPHYSAFLEAIGAIAPASLKEVLGELADREEHTGRTYNQTSVEVVGDWAERLGRIQRNAFTGRYYPVERDEVPANFAYVLLSVFDDLEETAGVSLKQRYLSIPELREHFCERVRCTRDSFDESLLTLAQQNVGKVELSGAPVDTGAKEAALGIKEMALASSDDLVSTSQSTEQVMAGVEQYGKQYYYLAVHDRELTFTQNDD
jgi:predicted transcriptional regulator